MNILLFYTVALCVGCLSPYSLSAALQSENTQLIEDESRDDVRFTSLNSKHLHPDTIPQKLNFHDEIIEPERSLLSRGYSTIEHMENINLDLFENDEDSSTEQKSDERLIFKRNTDSKNDLEKNATEENNKESTSSTSSESKESDDGSSSSEEKGEKRKIKKRSLDSKQDTVNAIGSNSNQSSIKQANDFERDITHVVETTITSPTASSESSPLTNNTLEVQINTTTISDSITEIFITESTTIESDSSSVTASETPTQNESGTTTEIKQTTETSEIEVTTEAESVTESASESGEEKDSELKSVTTTTERTEDDVSNEKTKESGTTQSTELEPPKPESNSESTFLETAMQRVNKLSHQIRLILMQYRKDHVVVLPGQKFFHDPMTMQDFRQSFSVGTMDFKNMKVFGLSNFTVEHINTDVDKMQVYILLHMKRLVILGNYTLRTFFSRAAGPFNVTLLDVDSEGVAEIETASEGHLEATDSEMDMFTRDMRVDFKNLGFMGAMFQGMVSTVGDALFNSIKPQILERVNLIIRTDVNKKLKEFSVKFVNKVSPVELAFSEGRKYARTHGYDPYKIKDHTFILGGLVYINITDFWVEGLSKFYRVGNLSLSMDAGVIQVGVHVVTQKLTGHCVWSGQTFGITKSGKTNFTVDHLQVRVLVNQSLDIRKKPQLEDLDLELGWVKVTMDSPMTLNLMIEGIINAFPRLIRHMIVDTLEVPLKEKIQEILNKINVESIVDENLPKLDNFGL